MKKLFFLIFSIIPLIPVSLSAKGKPKHSALSQNADPTCPINKNWVPDRRCTSPSPALIDVTCPQDLNEEGCDFYTRGFRQARADKLFMGQVYRRDWKSDEGDEPEFKQGYEAGWNKK